MLFGDLVSRLSNGPYGAYYGLLFGLVWDGILSGLTKSTDHPSSLGAFWDRGIDGCCCLHLRVVLWALVMGPFDSGGVSSLGPCFVYGI